MGGRVVVVGGVVVGGVVVVVVGGVVVVVVVGGVVVVVGAIVVVVVVGAIVVVGATVVAVGVVSGGDVTTDVVGSHAALAADGCIARPYDIPTPRTTATTKPSRARPRRAANIKTVPTRTSARARMTMDVVLEPVTGRDVVNGQSIFMEGVIAQLVVVGSRRRGCGCRITSARLGHMETVPPTEHDVDRRAFSFEPRSNRVRTASHPGSEPGLSHDRRDVRSIEIVMRPRVHSAQCFADRSTVQSE